VAGVMVGNYDEGTSLRDVLFQMRYIKGDIGKRCYPDLFALPEQKIFELISQALDETGGEIFQFANQGLLPATLDVRIHVDIFDLLRIFLVENEYASKIIFKRVDDSTLYSVTLGVGEFDIVFGKAYEYLDSLYEAEIR
jgi:hypothetical protein